MKKTKRSKLFRFLLTALIIAPTFIFSLSASLNYCLADATDPIYYQPQVSIPGSDFQAGVANKMDARDTSYIAKYVSAFYNYGLGLVGIIGVIVLMIGGIIWLTSAGNPNQVGQAKDLIIGSLSGIALLLVSWVLLNTINPNLVNFKMNDIGYVAEVEEKYCCDQLKGLVPASVNTSTKEIDYQCPGSAKICSDSEKCMQAEANVPGTVTKAYSCIKESDWTCCEYEDGIGYRQCKSFKGPTACNPVPGGFHISATYNNHVCDPDGGGSFGWKCYYGGRQCCQCRYNYVGVYPAGAYMSVDCQNNYTASECSSWCLGLVGWALGNQYTLSPVPATCQENGYCK